MNDVNTMGAVLGCIVWIPIVVWFVSLIHWMIMGEVDVITGVVGIWIAIGLGYLTFKPPRPEVSYFTFSAVFITVFMYPFVRHYFARRELKSVDIEALERAYDALAMKPDNPLARFQVAKRSYALGMRGQAIQIAEEALAYMPERQFLAEFKMLRQWKAIVTQPEAFEPINCVECHTPNPPSRTHCSVCGSPILLDRARGKFLPTGLGRKLLAAWMVMVLLLAGIPAATALPPLDTIVAIVFLVILAVTTVVIAFKERPKRTA